MFFFWLGSGLVLHNSSVLFLFCRSTRFHSCMWRWNGLFNLSRNFWTGKPYKQLQLHTRNISLITHLKKQYDMMPVPDEEEVDMLDLAWGLTDTWEFYYHTIPWFVFDRHLYLLYWQVEVVLSDHSYEGDGWHESGYCKFNNFNLIKSPPPPPHHVPHLHAHLRTSLKKATTLELKLSCPGA